MRIEVYTIENLLSLLDTDFFKTSPILPISRHRAISHYNNPKARKEDKVLWLLFEENELVAYRLVLPDEVYLYNKPLRMAWVSCVYVSPNCRGKGYGKKLTQLALDAWENRLMGTNFAPESRSMYKRMGVFEDFHTSVGFRGYLKLTLAQLLPKRNPKLRVLFIFFWIIDLLVNLFQKIRLSIYNNKLEVDIEIKKSYKVDNEDWQFIQSRQEKELTRRNQEELNWMLNLPWIIDPDKDEINEKSRFHFSAFDRPFEQFCLAVFYKKQRIGFLILTHRGKTLTVPYAYFDKIHTARMASVIRQKAIELKIDTLTIYQTWLAEYFHQHKSPFLLNRKINRYYLYSNGFPRDLKTQDLEVQDGIGDAGFT